MSLQKLHEMLAPMLYALRMTSTHHPTCPQLSGMACGALRDRGEALYSTLYGGPERVLIPVHTWYGTLDFTLFVHSTGYRPTAYRGLGTDYRTRYVGFL